jgi:hypothetical protein
VATPSVRQLVEAHAAGRERLTAAAVEGVARRTAAFDGWYDHAKIAALAEALAALVQAAQRQTAALTDAFLARVIALLSRRPTSPVGVVDVRSLRQGVTPAGVYGRPADVYRYQRSLDVEPARALELAVERARVAADVDVTLAFRAQARHVMVVRQVDGFRRVVHPELSAGGTCGLCIVAADRIYSRDDLLPVHARCACTVLPIVNEQDPGAQLDRAALDALYDRAGSNRAADLKRTRYSVKEHGELGAVLVDAADDWRGPAEVAEVAAAS